MSFDGQVAGYVVVAVLGACAGYGLARQEGLRERATAAGGAGHAKRKQHAAAAAKQTPPDETSAAMNANATAATASPFSSTAIQPYSPAPLPSSSSAAAAPSLPLLTSLSPAQVAAHPLLSAIGPFGLPQLPFHPAGGGGSGSGSGSGADATPADFHMTPPLFLRHAYIAAYNTKLHTPDWCLEMLTREGSANANGDALLDRDASSSSSSSSAAAAISRDHSSFKSDAFIASSFQASPGLFRSSGWDRGHLVPAADISSSTAGAATPSSSSSSSSSAAHSQKALDETFVMTNIAAQDPSLNRGYWLQLEHHLRKLARQHERVFVVTGPLFIPETTVSNDTATKPANKNKNNQESSNNNNSDELAAVESKAASNNGHGNSRQLRLAVLGSGPSSFVAVPTHFFKVVLVAPPGASSASFFSSTSSPPAPPLQLAAFIVPNAPVPLSTPLSSFQVPLEQVEHYAGWQMFGRLPRSNNNSTAAKASKSTPLAPRSVVVRDLCANGGCELKIKDFQFNNKH